MDGRATARQAVAADKAGHGTPGDQAPHVLLGRDSCWFAGSVDREKTPALFPVKLIAEGHTSQQIAALPTISPKTVDRHRAKILDKLKLRDRVDLTCYAVRVGRPRRTAGRVCC